MAQPFNKQYSELDTEFYTTRDTVLKLVPYLDKTKRYIEPFDRVGNSQIYQVLKELGFDIINLGKKFDDADNYDGRIIITNPPFISRGRLFSRMSKKCDEMIVIMTQFSYNCYTKFRAKDKCRRWCDEWVLEKLFDVPLFDTPNGPKKISCFFVRITKKV